MAGMACAPGGRGGTGEGGVGWGHVGSCGATWGHVGVPAAGRRRPLSDGPPAAGRSVFWPATAVGVGQRYTQYTQRRWGERRWGARGKSREGGQGGLGGRGVRGGGYGSLASRPLPNTPLPRFRPAGASRQLVQPLRQQQKGHGGFAVAEAVQILLVFLSSPSAGHFSPRVGTAVARPLSQCRNKGEGGPTWGRGEGLPLDAARNHAPPIPSPISYRRTHPLVGPQRLLRVPP